MALDDQLDQPASYTHPVEEYPLPRSLTDEEIQASMEEPGQQQALPTVPPAAQTFYAPAPARQPGNIPPGSLTAPAPLPATAAPPLATPPVGPPQTTAQRAQGRIPQSQAGQPQELGGIFAPEKPGFWSDFGRAAEIGGLASAKAITSLAGYLTDDSYAKDWLSSTRDYIQGHVDNIFKKLSPEMQQNLHSSLFNTESFGGQVDPATGQVPKPSDLGLYAAGAVAQAMPAILVAIAGGYVASRVAGGLLASAAVGTGARLLTTAGVFGALQAGDQVENLRETLKTATPEQMQQSPIYNQAKARGASDEQAKNDVFHSWQSVLGVAGQGLLGAATGVGLTEVLGRTGIGRAVLPSREAGEALTTGGRLRAGLASGAETGALFGAQAGGGQAIQQAVDPTRAAPVDWRQVGTTALIGAGVGGALGGVTGFALGPHTREGGSRGDGQPPGPRDTVTPAGPPPDQMEALQTYGPPSPAGMGPPAPQGMVGEARAPQVLASMRPPREGAPPEQILAQMRPQQYGPPVPPEAPESILVGMRRQPEQAVPTTPEQTLASMRPPAPPPPATPEEVLRGMREPPAPPTGPGAAPEDVLRGMRSPTEPAPAPSGMTPEATLASMRPPTVGTAAAPLRGPAAAPETILGGMRRTAEPTPAPTGRTPEEILGDIRPRPPGPRNPPYGGPEPPTPRPPGPRRSPEEILDRLRRGVDTAAPGEPFDRQPYVDFLLERGVKPEDINKLDDAGLSKLAEEHLTRAEAAAGSARQPEPVRETAPPLEPLQPRLDAMLARQAEIRKAADAMKKPELVKALMDMGVPGPTARRLNVKEARERYVNMRDQQERAAEQPQEPSTPPAQPTGRSEPVVEQKLPPGVAGLKTRQEAARARRAAGEAPPAPTAAEVKERLVKRGEAPPRKPEPQVAPTAAEERENLPPSQAAKAGVIGPGAQEPRRVGGLTVKSRSAAEHFEDLARTSDEELNTIARASDDTTSRRALGQYLVNQIFDKLKRGGIPERLVKLADQEWRRLFKASPKAELKSFDDYLRQHIVHLEDPQNLIRSAERDLAGPQNAAAKREANIRDARFQKEHIDTLKHLRDLLKSGEKKDPQINRMFRAQRAFPNAKVSPLSDALRRVPVNTALNELFGNTHYTGANARDYLSLIGNDPRARVQMPWLSFLARAFHNLVPEDLKIYSPEGLLQSRHDLEGYIRRDVQDILDEGNGAYYGLYDAKPFIVISHDAMNRAGAEAVMHEVGHAITQRYFASLDPGSRDYKVLQRIGQEFVNQAEWALMRVREGYEAPEFWRGLSRDDADRIMYALSDPHELYTHLTTNPLMREFASSLPISPMFRSDMRKLGYPVDGARSVWQSFTDFIRRVFGLPDQTKSLMDHILRPLEEITGRADEYNRMNPGPVRDAAMGLDRTYRSAIEGQRNRFMGSERIRDATRELLDPVNRTEKGNWLRRGLLQMMPPDGRVNVYGHLFPTADGSNLLIKDRDIEDRMKADPQRILDDYYQPAMDLVDRARGRDAMWETLFEATMNRTHLGAVDPQAANAHLTAAERERWLNEYTDPVDGRQPSLQSRYDALSAADKAIYQATQPLLNGLHTRERNANLEGLIELYYGDATDAQKAAIRQQLRTKAGVAELVDHERGPVADAFGPEQFQTNKPTLKALARFHDLGNVEGDFAPLHRPGDYVISYGDRGTDNYGVEMFEHLKDAWARYDELERHPGGSLNPTQPVIKSETHASQILHDWQGAGFVRDLEEAADRKFRDQPATAAALKDMVANQAMQHLTRSAQARLGYLTRREYIRGASKDLQRSLLNYVNSTAYRIAYAENAPALANVRWQLRNAVREARRGVLPPGADPNTYRPPSNRALMMQQIVDEIEKNHPQGDNHHPTGLQTKVGQITQMSFVHSLMSFGQVVKNSIEAHLTGAAFIGGRHGLGSAVTGQARAMTDMLPATIAKAWAGTKGSAGAFLGIANELKRADWQMGPVFRERLIEKGAHAEGMTKGVEALRDAGLLNNTLASSLRQLAEPKGLMGRKWQQFMNATSAMGHVMEEANKMALFKTAFDLELKKNGGNVDKAVQYGVQIVRDAVPNWQNKARIATHRGTFRGFGPAVFQFRNFGLHAYFNVLPTLVHRLREEARQSGWSAAATGETAKTIGMLFGTQAAVVGTLGWFADPLRLAGGAYDFATGKNTHDWELKAQQSMSDMFGPEVGQLIAKGGLYSLAGIDITHSIGMNNVFNLPDLKSWDKADIAAAAGELALGSAGNSLNDLIDFAHKMIRGDLRAALHDFPIRILRDPIQAYDFATQGVTDARGKIKLPPSKLSAYDLAMKAAGIQPKPVADLRTGGKVISELDRDVSAAKTEAVNAWVVAQQQGTGKAEAQRLVQRFNLNYPKLAIKPDALNNAYKDAETRIMTPGTFGMHVPKNQLPMVREATRFIPQ